MSNESGLRGRLVIAQIRVSRKKQAKNGLPQQAAWLHSYADEQGAIWVDERRESLGVSQTKSRPDVEYLLNRKALRNDFDTILLQDLSRLTRGGLEHGFDLYKLFKNAGILIATVLDGLIDNEDKLEQALKRFKEARAAQRLTSMVIGRGLTQSRSDGRSAYSKQIPFGVDRLITDQDRNPLFILRNLPDGRQVQFDPTGTSVIRTFSRNEDGAWRHYVRQDGEFLDLVKGASEAVQIVRHIMRRKFVDGWGLSRITRELNDKRLVSPKGGTWCRSSVRTIYNNPIYLGFGVCNQQATGEYWSLGEETQPMALTTRDATACRSEWMDTHRNEKVWVIKRYSSLINMLDSGLEGFSEPCLDEATKLHVKDWQFAELRRLASKQGKRRGGDKHVASPFTLKGILRSKQGKYEMTGRSFSHGEHHHRYYAVSRARSNPTSESILSTLIPAQLLEDEVMKVVKEAFTSFDGIEDVVRATVEEHQASDKSKLHNRPRLLQDQELILSKIEFWVTQLGDLGEDVVVAKVKPLKDDLAQIRRSLSQNLPVAIPTMPADEIVTVVRQLCAEYLATLTEASSAAVRQILQILVQRMEVDLETREVEIDLGLPSWSLNASHLNTGDSCLDNPIFRNGVIEAYGDWSIPLAYFSCTHERIGRHPCWTCRRTQRITSLKTGIAGNPTNSSHVPEMAA